MEFEISELTKQWKKSLSLTKSRVAERKFFWHSNFYGCCNESPWSCARETRRNFYVFVCTAINICSSIGHFPAECFDDSTRFVGDNLCVTQKLLIVRRSLNFEFVFDGS